MPLNSSVFWSVCCGWKISFGMQNRSALSVNSKNHGWCRCGEPGHWSSNCPGGAGRGRAPSATQNNGAFTPGGRQAGRASPGAGRGSARGGAAAAAGRGRGASAGRGIAAYFSVTNTGAGGRSAQGGGEALKQGDACFKCGQQGHWSSQCGKS